MKTLFKTVATALLLISHFAQSQNMNEGFAHLEKGEFDLAESFFNTILKEYPQNKTARLCYARAVGLNKQPEKALQLFVNLKTEFPDDLEIKLNYAESLLWNKNFADAKSYYSDLVKSYPDNFVANLGFANTLSNLKIFKDALYFVNQALLISKGNTGALVSRKYIKMGYANEKITAKEYQEAENFYDEVLADFPNDKEILLNKANLYLITKNILKGKEVYNILSKDNPILAINGLSLLEHIDNQDVKALELAQQALEKLTNDTDVNLIKQTQERYVQALIWNRKYKLAQDKIKVLNSRYENENWLLALSATLAIYRSNFAESIDYYQKILITDSKSFDGNLGISNAYYASGKIDNAIDAVKKTLQIFENQNDATNFLKKIYNEYTPTVEQKISYSFDNGDNEAKSFRTTVNFPVATKWSVGFVYQNRETKNKMLDISAKTNDFLLTGVYKFLPKANFNLETGFTASNSLTTSYNQFLINAFFSIKPLKLQDLELGYKRDLQTFNTALINRKIAADNYYLNYNIGTNFKLGWFTQYIYSSQTDGNKRNLLFTSLYYNFLSRPVLKGGFNYQYLAFQNQVPTIYFSPSHFNATEIFLELLKDEDQAMAKEWFYNLNVAAGYQFIENQEKQDTYRIQLKAGYKFSERFKANLYGVKSNIASAAASGFTFTEVGLRLKWLIFSKPVFMKPLQ